VWAVATVVVAIVVMERDLVTTDLTYHLRAGALMLRTHSIIRTDTFSFTARGMPWVDQQWLSQVLLYGAYRALGWAGLALLQGVLLGAIVSFTFLAARAAGAAARWAAGLSLAAFAISYENLAAATDVRRRALRDLPLDRLEP